MVIVPLVVIVIRSKHVCQSRASPDVAEEREARDATPKKSIFSRSSATKILHGVAAIGGHLEVDIVPCFIGNSRESYVNGPHSLRPLQPLAGTSDGRSVIGLVE